MNLDERLENARKYRVSEMPETEGELCLILESKNMGKLPGWLKRHPERRISDIIIADLPADTPISSNLAINGVRPKIMAGLAELANLAGKPKVFLFAEEWLVRIASMAIPGLAEETIYMVENAAEQFRLRKPMPEYYEKNRQPLNAVWNLLAGPEDKTVFVSRLKALLTGDSGYLKIASHLEYDHPLVKISAGDTVLDGGLSNMVSAQEMLMKKAGEKGVIHGFEPIPWMAEKAAENLKGYPGYHVHCAGLAESEGKASFASLGDSSHLASENAENAIVCDLTTIDKFVERNKLARIDAIKLDVEGAELAALKGGAKLIASQYPKLIVCLYHKPRDLYEIPLYIQSIAPDYEFHLAHSSAGYTDTILYAAKKISPN